MGKARAILKRRKAIQNIHKITRTMQLIATAQFQKAHKKTMASKPYTQKIMEMATNMAWFVEEPHPLLTGPPEIKKAALLILTGNRGLAGGYNSSVLHRAQKFIKEQHQAEREMHLDVVGKKGLAQLKYLKMSIENYFQLPDEVDYPQVVEIADRYIDLYSSGRVDQVHVAYTRFVSSSKQQPAVIRLLPLGLAEESTEETPPETGLNYEFELKPSPEALLDTLAPEAVRILLYQCFREAAVSEQMARMIAMTSATESAEEMIKVLGRQANKARQGQITGELLELIGGSEALI